MKDKLIKLQELKQANIPGKESKNNTLHIYCRVSTEGQLEGHSIEAQTKAGIYKASTLGMDYQIHKELGASAKHDNFDNRPVLKHLLDLCDDGKVGAIFVTEMDRLTRSPIAMYLIKTVLTENEVLLYTTSQRIDLRNEEDEFISDLTALLSRRENSIKSKRSKRGLREAALKGRWMGAILPYGYKKNEDRVLEINPDEAAIYREIVTMCFAGIGTTTIARKLNERRIPTRCSTALPNGTKVRNKYTGTIREVKASEFVWKAGSIYCILTNPLYAGRRLFKGEVFPFPAIIDDATFSKVQTQLKKNQHNSENNSRHFYLLKGMLRCSRCGSNLYGRIRVDGSERYYMCSSKREKSCGFRSINLDKLDAIVWSVVIADDIIIETLRKELTKNKGKERIEQLERVINEKGKQVDMLINRRSKIITLFEMSKVTQVELDERMEIIKMEDELVRTELISAQSELSIIKKNAEIIEVAKDDNYIKDLMKSWSHIQKREFLKSKHVDIVVSWHRETWSHTVEITFDSGYEVKEINAPNAPQDAKDKRQGYKDVDNNGSSLLMVAENDEIQEIKEATLPPLVTTRHRL